VTSFSEMDRFQDLARFSVPPGFRGRSAFVTQLWWVIQATIFACSPRPLFGWRVLLLRLFGARIGKGVKIRPSARITYPWKVTIGDNAWIGDRAELYSLERIEIGSDACVSQDCYLCAGSHDYRRVDFRYNCAPIKVGAEAWLAAGSFVGPGVEIGRGTVIGARSLVLTSTQPASIYAGSPARRIGLREKI
jgi:putative colanic acid biosynthesis acetyltransferase WcaF